MKAMVRRTRLEILIRQTWTRAPNSGLRALSVVYGAIADVRNAAWTLGLAASVRAPIPVISIGDLTIGGTGKTPITAALARYLTDAGSIVAILTAGNTDELALHAAWNPDIAVSGGRDRGGLARRAADEGASVVLLDSGFQHRQLERDFDIVAISADYGGNRWRLPAGPFRERWAGIARADTVVVVRRQAPGEVASHLASIVSGAFPGVQLAAVRIVPVSLAPVSPPAQDVKHPSPDVAVAGIMWPQSFFAAVKELGLKPAHRLALTDHAEFDERTVATVVDLAGPGGVVCTGKDAVKLSGRLPDDVPVWQIVERVVWETGGKNLLAAVAHVAGLGSNNPLYS